jgi:hypothetical protein
MQRSQIVPESSHTPFGRRVVVPNIFSECDGALSIRASVGRRRRLLVNFVLSPITALRLRTLWNSLTFLPQELRDPKVEEGSDEEGDERKAEHFHSDPFQSRAVHGGHLGTAAL